MIQALWWWLVAQAVALCALPLGLALFRPLADRGYGLTKALGLLLFGYVAWLLGASHLVPNGLPSLGLALLLLAGGSALVWRREGADLLAFWHRRRGLLLLEEAVFLGTFLGFLLVRSHNADIAGTEKFMDFAFLNAVTRSASFPPLDPWLAPSPAVPGPTINYYYLGYLIQGVLLELANALPGAVPPAVGFNLALGLLFALTATGAFGLVYGLARDLVAAPPRPAGSTPRPPAAPPPGRPAGSPPPRLRRSGPRGTQRAPRRGVWSLRAAWPYVAAGGLAVYLLLVAGNLWTALRLVDGSGMWDKDFWQGIGWNATRVLVIKGGAQDVDYTINEFPSFSFLLGDLHPHVLALPFAVLAVGLAYRWLLAPPRLYRWAVQGPGRTDQGPGGPGPVTGPGPRARAPGSRAAGLWSAARAVGELLPAAVILGALSFLNSWDFPAYFLLAQAGAPAGAWWEGSRPASPAGHAGVRLVRVAGAVAAMGVLALVAVAPFLLSFRPPVLADQGRLPLGLVPYRSLLSQFSQFWGGQLLLLAPAVLAGLGAFGFPHPAHRTQTAAPGTQHRGPARGRLSTQHSSGLIAREAPGREWALVLGGGLALVLLAERVQAGALLLALLLAAGAGWVAWRALAGEHGPGAEGGRALAFAFGAVCLAALLLATCEVVYIRDFYGGALRRMNTVFKLYYEAWLLFALGGGVAVFWLLRRLWRRRGEPGGGVAWWGAAGGYALLLLALALFPYKATLLRTEGFRTPSTLDGMAWLSRAQPDDRAAAEWLRLHAAPVRGSAPVVLEATGGPYSEFARIATQTGLPTVLGWDQHERLWRGASIEEEVAARKRDVDAIYGAATLEEARPLLDKYAVAYVVVGYLERQKYGAGGGLAKFDAPGGPEAVFRQGTTAVYRLARATP